MLVPKVITITAKAGAEGRLFGSVTTADVVDAVAAQTGIELDRRKLHLDEPIKTVGTHEVPASCTPTSSSRSPSRSPRPSTAGQRRRASRPSPTVHTRGPTMHRVFPKRVPTSSTDKRRFSTSAPQLRLARVTANGRRILRHPATTRRGWAGSAAQPPGRGVAARRDAAVGQTRSPSAIEVVSRDDFYKPAHGHIFEAITSLYGVRRAGRPGHRRRGAAPRRPARRDRRAERARRSAGDHAGDLQRGRATPTSSRSTRCCAG